MIQKTAALLAQCLDGNPEIQEFPAPYGAHTGMSHHRGYDEAIDFPSRSLVEHEAVPPPNTMSNMAPEEHHSRRRRERRRHKSPIHGADGPSASGPPRPRARTDEPMAMYATRSELGDGGRTSLEWLLDYEHISAHNLQNPFQNVRPNVVHSPKQNSSLLQHTLEDVYHPPPPAYGDPIPPHRIQHGPHTAYASDR